jgi:hypothetical protein
MRKVYAGLNAALLIATYILLASLPAANASGSYAPPYDYKSTGGYSKQATLSGWGADADTSTGVLQAFAVNYYISDDVWDAANAHAQLFREFGSLSSGSHCVYYSYYIHGSINSPVVASYVSLFISAEVLHGWWIFTWWDTVTTYYILQYTANSLQLSQSGSGYFYFNAPDNGATYRVDVELFVAAPPCAMGGSDFFGLPNDYATVSLQRLW